MESNDLSFENSFTFDFMSAERLLRYIRNKQQEIQE